MKSKSTLSISIFKSNLGFSLGLLALFIIGAALVTMSCILPATVSTSLFSYVDNYNMSQGNIITSFTNKDVEGLDNSIENISNVESRLVVDTQIKITDDKLKAMRLFSIEENGFRKYFVYEEQQNNSNNRSLWLTRYFASVLDIHAGEFIDVKTANGYESFFIEKIIGSPESISCIYDDTFFNEDFDFGHIFMYRKDVEDLYHLNNMANNWSFLFNDGADYDAKSIALEKAKNLLGDTVTSSQLYDDSKAKIIFDANMDSLSSSCNLFPYMMFVFLIVCAGLFLNQIINNQRKKIGLLRALGYKNGQIVRIFINYVSAISIVGILIGCVCAYFFNDLVIDEYKQIFTIPEIFYVIPFDTYIKIGVLFVVGILACLISTKGITKVDPSEAYSSNVANISSYHFKSKLFSNVEVFRKISLSKTFKNKRRLFMLAFSISACIILTFTGLACLHSKNASTTQIFGKRYTYDMLALVDNQETIDSIKNLDSVDIVEPTIIFTERFKKNGTDINIQYNALSDESKLVIPYNINKERVYFDHGLVMDQYIASLLDFKVGDYINVKGKDVRINALSCEYADFIQYISFDTAKYLGYDEPNACFFTIKEWADEEEVYKEISDITGFKYMKFLHHQEYMKITHQRALDLVYFAVIFLSVFIGLIIIFNMVVICVNERKFEYGTLIALGTNNKKFVRMNIIENSIQYLIASVIAFIPCYWSAELILNSLNSLQLNFPFVDIPNVYFEAFGLSLIYIIVGIIYALIRIKNINPAVTLNSRE